MSTKRNQIQLLAKAARSAGYTVKKIGTADTTMLGDTISVSNGSQFWMASAKKMGYFPNTPNWFKQLCNSKEMSNKVLRQLGYKVVTGTYFPAPKLNDDTFVAERMTQIKKYPVVCKPEQGVKGSGILVAYNTKQLQQYIANANKKSISFSAQPLVTGSEYRIAVFEHKVFVMHGKTARTITGNGKDSIETLCKQSRFASDKNYIDHVLQSNQMTYRTILPLERTLPIKIAKKDDPSVIYIEDGIPTVVQNWVLDLCKKLGCSTIGVDMIIPNDMHATEKYKIFEINSSPAFSYLESTYNCKELVDKIAKHIVDTSFNKK